MIHVRHQMGCCCPEEIGMPYGDMVYWLVPEGMPAAEARIHVVIVFLGCMPIGEPNNFASWERYANGGCPRAWETYGPSGRPFLLRWDADWDFVRANNTDDGIEVEMTLGEELLPGSGIWWRRPVEYLRFALGAAVMVYRRTAGVGLLFVPGESTADGQVSSLEFVTRVGPGIFRGAAPPPAITVDVTGVGPGGPGRGGAECFGINLSRSVPLVSAIVYEADGWALCQGPNLLPGEAAHYQSGPPVPPATGITIALFFGGVFQLGDPGVFVGLYVCSRWPGCTDIVPGLAFIHFRYQVGANPLGGPGDAFGVDGAWLAPAHGDLGPWCAGGTVQLIY